MAPSSCTLAEEISLLAAADDNDEVPRIPSTFVLPLHRRHHNCSSPVPLLPIPIIDVAQYDDMTSNDMTSDVLHRACTEWGLFHIINHGVPHVVLQQMQMQIEHFLALPIVERSPCLLGNRGQGYGTGFIRPTTGVTEWRDCMRLATLPPARRQYNDWPLSPHFRKAIEDFSEEMCRLQQKFLCYLSQNLGLHASRLGEIVGDIQQTFLMNHYPPCPQPSLAAGVDQHTDVGAISCLWQYDDVVGLQVFKDGAWVPVPPVPGAITIILGDQIEIASNGIYKSPLHRGVLNASKRRVSVVAFYHLKPEQVVEPAAELIDAEHPPLYQAKRFADHEAA
eukprot:c29444_g1_i1 orf=112-1119(-)